MLKKRLLIIGLLTLLFSIFLTLTVLAEEGCCIQRDGCRITADASECIGDDVTYESVSCTTVPACTLVCCEVGGGNPPGIFPQGICDVEGVEHAAFNPFDLQDDTGIPYPTVNEVPSDIVQECSGLGPSCNIDADCLSGFTCQNNECIAGDTTPGGPTCLDTVHACGGSCAPCGDGGMCSSDGDCVGQLLCHQGTCQAATATALCKNGVFEPGEECEEQNGQWKFLATQSNSYSCSEFPGGNFASGEVTCSESTCTLDTSTCVSAAPVTPTPTTPTGLVPEGTCGDGTVNPLNENNVVEHCERDGHCGTGYSCESCQCTARCVSPSSPTWVGDGVTFIPQNALGNSVVTLEWTTSFDPSVCSFEQYYVYRCEGYNCIPQDGLAMPYNHNPGTILYAETETSERSIQPGKTYGYQIGARFIGNPAQTVYSDVKYIATVDEVCMGSTGSVCKDGKVYDCSTGLQTSCASDEYCSANTDDEQAACLERQSCNLCNGLFEVFGEVLGSKLIDVNGVQTACRDLFACALDTTKTSVDKYHGCESVNSCYDYLSEAACENDYNHCGIAQEDNGASGCEWKTTYAEAGKGVCVPKTISKVNCDACNTVTSRESNVFNACNEFTCQQHGKQWQAQGDLEGVCIFSGGSCVEAETLGCNAYESLNQCDARGAGQDLAHAIYPQGSVNPSERTGSFALNPSLDRYGFGRCRPLLNADGSFDQCVKDANNDYVNDCSNSLGITAEACNSDLTSPTTRLVPNQENMENGKLLLGREVNLELSANEPGNTYFCFGKNCAPQELAICNLQYVGDGTTDGERVLRYYTEDRAGNLEYPINEQEVHMDSVPPHLNIDLTSDAVENNDVVFTLSNPAGNGHAWCTGSLKDLQGRRVSTENALRNAFVPAGEEVIRHYLDLADNYYMYWLKCKDKAGNEFTTTESINVDTNRITINSVDVVQEHTGSLSVTFSTTESASCGYLAQQGNPEYLKYAFRNTQPLDGAGTKQHTLTVTPTGEYIVYQMVCQFADGEESAANDRVVAYQDTTPPTVGYYSRIDRSKTFNFNPQLPYAEQQVVFVTCDDNHLEKTYHIPGDKGCQELTYSIDGFDQPPVRDLTAPVYVPITQSIANFRVTASDGINTYTSPGGMGVTFSSDISAVMEVTDEQGKAVTGTLGPYRYNVKILGNRDFTVSSAVFTDVPAQVNCLPANKREANCLVDLTGLPRNQQLDNKKITASLSFTGQGASCFTQDKTIMEQQEIVSQAFTIITDIPEIRLSPLLDGATDCSAAPGCVDYEDETGTPYPIRYYPKEGRYYTGESNLFITGYVRRGSEVDSVEFYGGVLENTGGHATYTLPQPHEVQGEKPFTVVDNAEAGTRSLLVRGSPQALGILSPTQPELYFIKLRSHNDQDLAKGYQTTYGKFQYLYGVDKIEQIGQQVPLTNITLSTPLEEAVNAPSARRGSSCSDDSDCSGNNLCEIGQCVDTTQSPQGMTGYMYVYSNPEHALKPGRFGQNIELQEGENYVSVRGVRDEGGQKLYSVMQPAERQPVFLDTAAPQATVFYPLGTTNEDVLFLNVTVEELKNEVMLIDTTVRLLLEEEGGRTRNLPATVREVSTGNTVQYKINTSFTQPLPDGEYTVTVQGFDKAGSVIENNEWEFIIDKSAPDGPEWTVGREHDNTHYITLTQPTFTLDFSKNTEDIVLEKFTVKDLERRTERQVLMGPDAQGALCTESSENVFACTVSSSDSLIDGDLGIGRKVSIKAFAHKQYDTGRSATAQYESLPVIIDNSNPQISSAVTLRKGVTAKITEDFGFNAVIPNEKYAVNASLFYTVTGKEYFVLMTENEGNGNYRFVWPITQYTELQNIQTTPALESLNRVELRVKDYAGNQGLQSNLWGQIALDGRAPLPSDCEFIPKCYYQHNSQTCRNSTSTLTVTGIAKGDTKNVFVTPGSFDGKEYSAVQYGYMDPRSDKFTLEIALETKEGDVAQKQYTFTCADDAGNTASTDFTMIVDRKPPENPLISIQ
jgi:hypothetical protein